MKLELDIRKRDKTSNNLVRHTSFYAIRLRPENNREFAKLETICNEDKPLKIEFKKVNWGAGIEYSVCFTEE